jgi:large subunit ribosomal protein L5
VSNEKTGQDAPDPTRAEEAVSRKAQAVPAGQAAAEVAPPAQDKGAPKSAHQKGQKGEKPAKKEQAAGTGAKGKGGKAAPEAAAPRKGKAPRDPVGYIPRLKKLYRETVCGSLREEFAYKTPMQVPRLSKIVVSLGIGEAITNKKLLESATAELAQITGMKAVRTKAKKSIAQFKVRKGMDIGAMVTLRGKHMYEFLDRLINVAMPRIKDFRGANPNAFDGHGNYSLGVTEQIIFPEIDYDKIERVSGMNVAIVTTAHTDGEARSLLARLGMPFRK